MALAASAFISTFDADANEDDIKALVAQSQKRSAVFDIVTNPTNVIVRSIEAVKQEKERVS